MEGSAECAETRVLLAMLLAHLDAFQLVGGERAHSSCFGRLLSPHESWQCDWIVTSVGPSIGIARWPARTGGPSTHPSTLRHSEDSPLVNSAVVVQLRQRSVRHRCFDSPVGARAPPGHDDIYWRSRQPPTTDRGLRELPVSTGILTRVPRVWAAGTVQVIARIQHLRQAYIE